MCLSFFVLDAAEGPRFLLAFNRDEYFDRRTQPLHEWSDGSGIIGGRDLEGKGTWLGVTRSGRVAFLTNLRSSDPVAPHTHANPYTHASRGGITTAFLTGDASPANFAQSLDAANFHGFNLVLAELAGPAPSLVYTHNGALVTSSTAEPAGNCNRSGGGGGCDVNGSNGPVGAREDGKDGKEQGGLAAGKRRLLGASTLGAGFAAAPADGAAADVEVALGQLAVTAAGQSSPRAEAAGPGAAAARDSTSAGGGAGSCTQGAEGAATSGSSSRVQALKSGVVYGVSNGLLLEWPKVASGVAVLSQLLPEIRQGQPVPWSRLFIELLGDDTRLVPPSCGRQQEGAAEEAGAQHQGASTGGISGGGVAAAQAVAPADEVAAHVGSGAAVHVDGRPIAPAPAGAGAGAGAGHNRGHGHGHGSNSSSSSSGCSNGAGGNGGGCSSAAGGGGGGGGGAGDSYFERELEHITSGRFVAEVDSPFGKYGTRSQTALVVWLDGRVEMRERAREPDGSWRESALDFAISL
ncbi:hypothetical protein CHLRE_12g548550v5 [Chlamydomonas reinhardtii]|uniref:Uncharacterized protein n=1 Tax=Chlamydomonas reinhardtii TaxID=3055 RepID=A0A2K3D6C9_CHLRE|nr:uncharacterized protein CHLRE_12g548550v5 [Chlamydomonas reinhardtii]PNW76081.1 hypothetical protein CHLRE_12g548550v5 [Chlamydomonas reinhardtii]